MRLELHPHARSDIARIVDYYKRAGGSDLVDEFYSELRSFFDKVANSPEAYAIRERDIRRVNLEKFHFTFCFASLMIACEYWWFVTTAVGRRWEFIVAKRNSNRAADHFSWQEHQPKANPNAT